MIIVLFCSLSYLVDKNNKDDNITTLSLRLFDTDIEPNMMDKNFGWKNLSLTVVSLQNFGPPS